MGGGARRRHDRACRVTRAGASEAASRSGPRAVGGAAPRGSRGSLCDIRWEAALGDDMIGLAELRELARLKQPLVRVRGQWVELRQEDLAAAIAAVGKKGDRKSVV